MGILASKIVELRLEYDKLQHEWDKLRDAEWLNWKEKQRRMTLIEIKMRGCKELIYSIIQLKRSLDV